MPYLLQSAATPQQPYGQVTRFTVVGVQPPAAAYITASDTIVYRAFAPTASGSFTIGLRLLDITGTVVPLQRVVQIANTAAGALVASIQASEGFLLGGMVSASGFLRGQCFVQVFLQRGLVNQDSQQGELLMQGYVTNTESITWPGGRIASSLEPPGFPRGIPMGTPPKPGSVSITVPAGVRWLINAVSIQVQPLAPPELGAFTLTFADPTGNVIGISTLLYDGNSVPTVALFTLGFGAGSGGISITPGSAGFAVDLSLYTGCTVTLDYEVTSAGGLVLGPATLGVQEFVEV